MPKAPITLNPDRPGAPALVSRSWHGLRVMDVTKFYAPGGGGVRTYLDAKIRDFHTRPVTHTLVIPGPEHRRELRGSTTVYQLPGVSIPGTPGYRLLLRARTLRSIIETEKPDVIEVGSPFLVPLLTRWAAQGRRVSLVGFYHADLVRTYVDPYVERFGPGLQEWIQVRARRYVRRVYSGFDATVAASLSVARELQGLGVPNVRRISLGVDLDLFRPERRTGDLRARLGIGPEVPIALFAGRLCPEKGLGVVEEAHGRMKAGSRPHLLFVGEGPSAPTFQNLAREREDFTVLPFVANREELARIYASADLYLATGPGETFGLSVAEAMASGLPVVAVDSGAAPDRVQGSGAGELYVRGDAESARMALERMVRRLNPELGRRARDHAALEYGWRKNFDALLELYMALVRKKMAA